MSREPAPFGADHFGGEGARIAAAHLGMWVFIATEVLLFGALFTSYGVYRLEYPELFHEARTHMSLLYGTFNTYVLVTSSIFVALAIWAIRSSRSWLSALLLSCAMALGIVFMVVKGLEYAEHVREGAMPGHWYALEAFAEPGANLYFSLYYLLTGLHAVHVMIGTCMLGVLAFQTAAGKFSAVFHTPLELGGMYWHLVDVIWLFVWPLLYLV